MVCGVTGGKQLKVAHQKQNNEARSTCKTTYFAYFSHAVGFIIVSL